MITKIGHLIGDAFKIIVRNPILGGFPRLKGLAPGVRVVVLTTLLASLLTAVAVGFSGQLRYASPLLREGGSGSPVFVPVLAVMIVPYLVSLGLGVVMAGSIGAPTVVAYPIVGVYFLLYAALARFCHDADPVSRNWQVVLALTATTLLFFIAARRMTAIRTAFTALSLLLTVSTMAFVIHSLAAVSSTVGTSLEVTVVRVILQAVTLFCLPLAFVAGLDATKFGITVANWAAERVSGLRSAVSVAVVPIFVLGVSWTVVFGRVQKGLSATGVGFVFGVVTCCVIMAISSRIGMTATEESDDEVIRASQTVAMALSALVLLVPLTIQTIGLLEIVAGSESRLSKVFLHPISDWLLNDHLVLSARLLLGAALLLFGAQKHRSPLRRCVMLVTGCVLFISNMSALFTETSIELSAAQIDVVVLTASTVYLLERWIRRRLTGPQALRVAGLVVLTGLSAQNAFSSGPLAAILPLGGLALLVFGLVWGALTGAGDANESSPTFGTASRLTMFAGYQLLTIAIVLWATMLREPSLTDQLSSSTALGVRTIGIGLLVAMTVGHAKDVRKEKSVAQ